MTDYIKHINNVEAGEITVEPMTDEEIAVRETEIAEALTARETKAAEAEAQKIAKAALLDRLGITADEAKLLLS